MKVLLKRSDMLISVFFVSIFFSIDPGFGLFDSFFLKFVPVFLILLFFVSVIFSGVTFLSGGWYSRYVLIYSLIAFIISVGLVFLGREVSETYLSRSAILFSLVLFMTLIANYEFDILYDYIGRFTELVVILSALVVIGHLLGAPILSSLPHVYHEEVSLLLFGVLYGFSDSRGIKRFLFFILGCIVFGLSFKNTGYITFLIMIFSCFLIWLKNYSGTLRANISIPLALLFFLSFFVLLFWIIYNPDVLPSGSPGVRLATYEARTQEFLSNPIFGSWFSSDMLFHLPTMSGDDLVVPSHSDILDALAVGGGAFSLVFLVPFFYSTLILFTGLIWERDGKLILLSSVVLSYTLNLFFNPIVNQPDLMVVYVFSVVFLERMRSKNFNVKAGLPA